MQVFVVGPPRSGTTIVSQMLNAQPRFKIFDEVDFIDIAQFGANVVGKLQAFLMERGVYDDYRRRAAESGDCTSALHGALTAVLGPEAIWGEKNPMYATRLEVLRQTFPDALILFVLRDPREVVNSYLAHRDSPSRARMDFWIKDTVSEALDLVETCLQPLRPPPELVWVLRYERFVEDPKRELDEILKPWGVELQEQDEAASFDAPETYGDHQFFRRNAVLPWKSGNLSPLRRTAAPQPRIDPGDPAWARVEALAKAFDYD